MDPTLASLALGAGALSILSPCNVAMIPSYFSVGVVSGENSAGVATIRGIRKSLVASWTTLFGFMSLFGVLGLLVSISFRAVVGVFPMASIAVSVGLLVMGGLMVLDVPNPLMKAFSFKLPRGGGTFQYYLLGVAYGGVSLSCTLPAFLMIVSYAAILGNLSEIAITMVIYAGGVGLMLTLLSVIASSSRSAIVKIRTGLAPRLPIVAGSVVVVAALYMITYQLYHFRWVIP